MKSILCFLLLFPFALRAQIKLEKTYAEKGFYLALVQTDTNEWRYIYQNRIDTIKIFALDHTLIKSIFIPTKLDSMYFLFCHFSKRLFDLDDKYEYILYEDLGGGHTQTSIYNEDGDTLFQCQDCWPNEFTSRFFWTSDLNRALTNPKSIINTPDGTKLILSVWDTTKYFSTFQIYSLPGRLPTSNTKLGVTDEPNIILSGISALNSFPNPSSGQIRIEYKLPEGETTGEIVISTTDGKEVKRYKVGNVFNDILIEKSELRSGAYFYKLVTPRGASEAKKFIITE